MLQRPTLVLIAFLLLFPALFGQAAGNPSDSYKSAQAWIVARDGIRLYTENYTPVDAKGQLPMMRSWKIALIEKYNPEWKDLVDADGEILPLPKE